MAEYTPDQLREMAGGLAPGIGIRTASTYTVTPIDWLWPGWLARGKVHIIAGAPAAGKTSLALAMGAAITIGGNWPDGGRADDGEVLIWSGEDDPADTLLPRLMAARANLERVHIIHSTHEASDKGKAKSRAFDPATDIDMLADEIAGMTPAPRLLIVDPVVSAVAGDSNANGAVRRALQPLVDLAMARQIAVIGITHFSKGTAGRDPVERVTGSLAFGALARVVMVAAKRTKEEGGGRILARGKSNIGPDEGGFVYDLEVVKVADAIETTCVKWGEAIGGTAREILGEAETLEDPEERAAWEEARDWLEAELTKGPGKASDLQRAARVVGITDKSLRTARVRLGIRPIKGKQEHNGAWVWKLPHLAKTSPDTETPPDIEDAQHAQHAQDALKNCQGNGHLLGQVDHNLTKTPAKVPEDAQKPAIFERASWASRASSNEDDPILTEGGEAVF